MEEDSVAKAKQPPVSVSGVEITHPEKVFFLGKIGYRTAFF